MKKGVSDLARKAEHGAKHMDYVVKDAETIADFSKKLRHELTDEAEKEIKQAIQKASKTVSDVFRKQDDNLEEIIGQLNGVERDLINRSEDAKTNASKAARGSSDIKEAFGAREGLKQAEFAALEDARFTSAESERAGKQRKQSEQASQDLKRRFSNTIFDSQPTYGLAVLDDIKYRKPIIRLHKVKKNNAEKAKRRKDAQKQEAELEDKRRRDSKKRAKEIPGPTPENDKYKRNFPGYDSNRRPKYKGVQDQ